MPIKFIEAWGDLCPVVECDWCGQRIMDADDGNVYWLHDDPETLYFNHKRCAGAHDRTLEDKARPREALVLSEHLGVFLAQLVANVGKPEAMPAVD